MKTIAIFYTIAICGSFAAKPVPGPIPKAAQIENEVEIAYGELLTTTYEVLSDLQQQSEDYRSNLYFDLEENRSDAVVEIMSKIEEISGKLENMDRKLSESGINVTDCTDKGLNYLIVYRDELLLRLNECMDTFGSDGFDSLDQNYLQIESLGTDHLICVDKAIELCTSAQGNNNCLEEVLTKIEAEQIELPSYLKLLSVEALNRYQNFDVPCKEMIMNDMAFYPGALLRMVENCIDFAVKKNLKSICGI